MKVLSHFHGKFLFGAYQIFKQTYKIRCARGQLVLGGRGSHVQKMGEPQMQCFPHVNDPLLI